MPTIDFDTAPATTAPVDGALLGDLPAGPREIPVEQIYPHPHNPRRDVGDVSELAADIKQHGILQALLVVPDPGDPERYLAVIGHRRLAASKLAGRTTVPAFVDPTLTLADQIERMLSENVQRADLTPVEEAFGYAELLDLGMTVAQAAKGTGRSETTVRRRLKIVDLPDEARQRLHEGQATLDDVALIPARDEDPEMHDALAAALGTRDFAWTRQKIERDRESAEKRAKVIAELERLGVTRTESSSVPDGYVHAGFLYGVRPNGSLDGHGSITNVTEDGAAKDWIFYAPGMDFTIQVYRPITEAERQNIAEAREAREREAEQRRAQDADRAAREDFAATSAATRAEFIRGLVKAKRTSDANAAALVKLIGDFMATPAFTSLSVYLTDDDAEEIATHWLGVDPDAIAAQAEERGLDHDALYEDAIRDALAAVSPAGHVLAAIADALEPIPAWWWAHESQLRYITRWYEFLRILGYKTSTAELEALAGRVPAPGTQEES